jgi:hypothetical protein
MRFDASATAFEPKGRLRLVQPRRQFERIAACSSAVSGAARAEAREMSSPNPCHRPVVKERLEKLQLIDRQKAVVHLGSAAMAQSLMCPSRCPLLPHTQPFTNLFTPQLHLIFLSYCILTPNASPSWEDRHLPVRWWTLASTKCRTLGQKNGMLKSRTDMFSNPMRRGWGSSGGPTGQGQVPGALNVEEGFAQVSSGSYTNIPTATLVYIQQHMTMLDPFACGL